MLVEMIFAALTTEPTIVALLGTSTTRPDSTAGVFPTQAAEQPTAPYIVITQASGEPLSETFHEIPQLTSERWRVSCYGSTYANAKKLAKTVRRFLIGLSGTTGTVLLSGVFCKAEADEAETIGRGTLFATHLDCDFISTDTF